MSGAAGFRGQAQPARVHVILGDEVTCSDGIHHFALISEQNSLLLSAHEGF